MCEDIRKQNWHPVLNSREVNEAWRKMKNIILEIFDRQAPKIVKKVRGKLAPWLTDDVKNHMNERDRLLRKFRKTPHIELYRAQYKQKRNLVNIAIRRAKASYYKDLLSENSTSDPNKFWKSVKSIYPGKAKSLSNNRVFEIDGKESSDKTEISNGFCSFFMNIVSSLKQKSILLKTFAWQFHASIPKRTTDVFKFQFVTNMDVEKIIKSIKRSKATGIDDLPPGLIKDAADVLSVPLSHIINVSLDTGQFSQEWKSAKIIPLHKSGSTTNFDNYRPISVLPIVSKVIEKIVQKQLINFLDQTKLLSTRQFGFRAKMSTELAATLLLDDIRKSVDEGQIPFIFWDKLKSFMPGTSESAFLRSLEDISMDRNRQGTVNKTAFAQCYKEWKFCHMQTEVMQMKNLFECPSCSIQQHSSHVDGNCKLYRYKSSGKRRRQSFYGDLFFCDDKLVDNALQIIYNNPDIGRISVTFSNIIPAGREEAITEHAAAWNKRKLENFILNLRKRYQHILEKQKKVQEEQCQKLQKCPCPITVDMYEDWKREAVLNAQEFNFVCKRYWQRRVVYAVYAAEEIDKLPDIEDHVCVVEDVIPMKLSILRLKVFSKSLDALQRRYCTLNEQFLTNEDSVLENTEENSLNVYESIFSAHQRRIEATAYSIIHMTNNLNKLADLLEKESEHEASSGVQNEEGSRYDTAKKSPDVVKGKMALVSRGINYCKLQLQSACKVFSTCIDRSTAAEPDVAFETCHNDAVSYSEDDAEFFEEDSSEFRDLAELSDASLSDSENDDMYF
eukprot:gene5002-5659_t